MSKKNTKKQARKANILTLGVSDLAPIVGSIIADKDAIIIKKMPNGGAAVFFSDQNGNVIGTGDNEDSLSKNETFQFVKNNIHEIKNLLENFEGRMLTFNRNEMPADIPIIFYDNEKKIDRYKDKNQVAYNFLEASEIKVKSEDYPTNYVMVGGGIIGKDLPDYIIPKSAETIPFYKLDIDFPLVTKTIKIDYTSSKEDGISEIRQVIDTDYADFTTFPRLIRAGVEENILMKEGGEIIINPIFNKQGFFRLKNKQTGEVLASEQIFQQNYFYDNHYFRINTSVSELVVEFFDEKPEE